MCDLLLYLRTAEFTIVCRKIAMLSVRDLWGCETAVKSFHPFSWHSFLHAILNAALAFKMCFYPKAFRSPPFNSVYE